MDKNLETIALDAHPIVFFDGVCGLCNRLVDIVVRMDKEQVIRFAPIQGETARALLPALSEDAQEWSMFYLDGTELYSKSDAFLQVCRRLGGLWTVLSLARVVPRWLRDPVYCMVARHRYRWFGKRAVCRVPSVEERERFLN